MKNNQILGLLIVGLLTISGVVGAGQAAPTGYVEISSHYEAIRLALVADSIEGMAEHAKAMHQQVSGLLDGETPESAGMSAGQTADYQVALREIESAASNLSATTSLASAREDFFALTKPMARYRKLMGIQDTVVAYCPMAQKTWIQPQGEIGNPYLGQEMPKCGDVVEES